MRIETDVEMFGWTAIDADTFYGHGSPIGVGATEWLAIDDLVTRLMERGELPDCLDGRGT